MPSRVIERLKNTHVGRHAQPYDPMASKVISRTSLVSFFQYTDTSLLLAHVVSCLFCVKCHVCFARADVGRVVRASLTLKKNPINQLQSSQQFSRGTTRTCETKACGKGQSPLIDLSTARVRIQQDIHTAFGRRIASSLLFSI